MAEKVRIQQVTNSLWQHIYPLSPT